MIKYFIKENELYIIYKDYLIVRNKSFVLNVINKFNIDLCSQCDAKEYCDRLGRNVFSYVIVPRLGRTNLFTNHPCVMIKGRGNHGYTAFKENKSSLFLSRYIKVNLIRNGVRLEVR